MGAKKSKAGRPAKFTTTGEMEQAVEAYFTQDPDTPTLTGLALALGFESRQSLYAYELKGEFSYTIKRARLRVEHAYEKRLLGNSPTGAIFALKNLGWSDKIQQEVSGPDGKPIETHSTFDKPLEVIIKRMDQPQPDSK